MSAYQVVITGSSGGSRYDQVQIGVVAALGADTEPEGLTQQVVHAQLVLWEDALLDQRRAVGANRQRLQGLGVEHGRAVRPRVIDALVLADRLAHVLAARRSGRQVPVGRDTQF